MPHRRIAIVPHTHWDREWYEPFQTFRMRLVELIDTLLTLMEEDPSYERFLLDGQMAVVDDYLEVRPEHEDRLRRLAASGRIEMGPWYILMDEFLVSAETIVRNLQLGIRRGAAFGGVSSVGYLPDMFGHIAQMPQILSLAGFAHTAVWRGVPSEITESAFRWHAPDGSSVRAEYLLDGYGNASSLPDDAKALVARVDDHVAKFSTFLGDEILMMNGSDHLLPQPFLGRVIAEANEIQDTYEISISGLADHVARGAADHLADWVGELRSGVRANVLMGVASNRVDVKRAAAITEHALERRAEPLSAMFLPPASWPQAFLDIAWREVIRNSAHDSICACSVDEVVDSVLHRFAEAREIAEGLAERALIALGTSMRTPGYVIANATGRARAGVVELLVSDDGYDERAVQVVSTRTALPGELLLDAGTAQTLIDMIQGPRLDDHAWITHVDVEMRDGELRVDAKVGPFERPGLRIDEARQSLVSLIAEHPSAPVRFHLDQPSIRRVLARSADVPALGWRRFEPAPLAHPATADDTGAATIANGLVTVVIDPVDGTFSLNGHAGFGRLVDVGDLGDSYNYSPPQHDDVVDTPTAVSIAVTERGPVRASAVITSTYRWFDHIDGATQRRVGDHEVTVETLVQVVADEPYVTVRTTFVNPARDHRLRVHVPTVAPATNSVAECAFGTVERGLTAEGRPGEFGLPTFPSRRFVTAGRTTIAHQGLHEYEVTALDDGAGSELALTLLRSTGMLSRLGMTMRPMPAGPLTAVEGLQLVGERIVATYAIALDVVDPWVMVDDVCAPLETTFAQGGGWRGDEGSAVAISGAVVSSLQVVDGCIEVRVFNPDPSTTTVEIEGRRGFEVDLRGRLIRPFEGSLELRGHGIATLRLASPSR